MWTPSSIWRRSRASMSASCRCSSETGLCSGSWTGRPPTRTAGGWGPVIGPSRTSSGSWEETSPRIMSRPMCGGPTGVWRALAKGIAVGVTGSEDYTRTIMTYHACGSPCVFHGDPWFSLNMIEVYEDPARVYPAVSRDYHATPTKPTGIGEGFYENDNDGPGTPTGTAYDVRREAYWSFLAGGYYTYGARPIFFFGGGWQRALDLPGARHMSIRRRLLTSRPWWTFVPDQGILARGEGSGDTLNAAARSADGRSIIVYLSHPSVVSVNMGKITGRHMVKAQWFDPGSGRRTDAGVFPNTGTRSFFTPRGWRDAILLLDVASPA